MAARNQSPAVVKDDKDRLYELIEELSTSGESKLDEKTMKDLKALCKKSDENLGLVYRMLLNQMEKEHAEIRLSCFQMINELFLRSHKFRLMVLGEFHCILELCVETNDDKKLPLPRNVAKVLKSTALSEIENWYQKFGSHYKKLELGYDFLKRVKKVDFAGMRSRTLLEQQRQESLEAREKELEKRAIEKVEKEMRENCLDIESTVTQGNACLNLVLPRPCDLYGDEKPDKLQEQGTCDSIVCHRSEITSKGNAQLQDCETNTGLESGKYHGIPTQNYKLTITIPLGKTYVNETEDNKDLLANLHDLMNEIASRYIPMVNKWINILTKCNNVNDKLEKCLQLRDKLKESTEKYKEIEVVPQSLPGSSKATDKDHNKGNDNSHEESDNDEEFEDVPEAIDYDFGVAAGRLSTEQMSTASFDKERYQRSKRTDSQKRSEKLKQIAPVVPYDNDLKYWGSKKLHITPITKNDSLHKFWSHSEVNDDFIPHGLEESLRSRAICFAGKFEAVKWKCRAPMANGRLCERQDRLKCPFHGKIIPRDDSGAPCNENDFEAENERKRRMEEKETDAMFKDIETATGQVMGSHIKKKTPNKSKLRYSRLTDLKTATNNTRKRLEKKVLHKGSLRRVDEALTAIEKRRNLEKFGSNFNYQYEY